MSNSTNPQNQTLDLQPSHSGYQTQQWESMARAWLSTLPEDKTVAPNEVETWLQSNQTSIPDEVRSMPRSQLYERLNSIQNSIAPSTEEKPANQVDPSQARFQRTDQWMPVYAWLESLDSDEVIKSKDILDWLSENPEVKESLYSKHSRYHLMHYIKKCHVKILKRKERKKGLQVTNKENSPKVNKSGGTKPPVPLPFDSLSNLPKDSDVYLAKRSEALQKFEILVELEKHLSAAFPKQHENALCLKDS
ncbi:unnamed protein product [Ilex paraguariensis]|uniref:Uncharacterized protein n=1 Tax=Ilex paraguariensis TaxID=185542 RepID=A0ABC8TLC8_9AQUA